jgi:hypothetical protein
MYCVLCQVKCFVLSVICYYYYYWVLGLDRGWLGPVRLRRRAGALGPWQPPDILPLCDLRTSQCRMAHGIDLWCNATRPHWTRPGSGPSTLLRAPRTSPAGVANAGPSDFLFTAAADYLLLRIVTRHNVGTSAVNGSSFSTLEVPDALP